MGAFTGSGYLSALNDSIFYFTRYRSQYKELADRGFGSAGEIRERVSGIGFEKTEMLEFAGDTYNVTNKGNKATFEMAQECAEKRPEFAKWKNAKGLASQIKDLPATKERLENAHQVMEIIKEIGPTALHGDWRSIVGLRKEKPEKKQQLSPYHQLTSMQKYALYLSNQERVFRKKEIANSGFCCEFEDFLGKRLSGLDSIEKKVAEVERVLLELRCELHKSKGWAGKAISFLRRPKISKWRMAAAIALMAPGALIGLGLLGAGALPAAAALATAGAVLAGIGKFAFVDAIYDKIHHKISGRRGGKFNIAAQVFYQGKDEAIRKRLQAEYEEFFKRGDIAAELRAEIGAYANRMRKHRIAKYSAALAFAILPINPLKTLYEGAQELFPRISEALFSDHGIVADTISHVKEAVADTLRCVQDSLGLSPNGIQVDTGASQRAAIGVVETPGQTAAIPATSGIETFAVPSGGGHWHVAKQMASQLSGFDLLSPERQNLVISAIKNTLVDNPSQYGLSANEIIAGSPGCEPGLFKGASATLSGAQKGAFQRLSDLMSVDSGRIPAEMQQNRFTVAKLTSLLENRAGSSWKEAFGAIKADTARVVPRIFGMKAVPVAP